MRLFLMVLSLIASSSVSLAAEMTKYRVLAQDKGHVAIVGADGKVEWEFECKYNSHDIHLLPNGNLLLHTGPTTVSEVTPEKKVVWKYESKPTSTNKGRVEVHAFQRLENGNTMIAESGNRRIIEVNKDGKIEVEVPLTIKNPNAHSDTRMVRKLANGNYLVCQESDGKVCEYDARGKVVWSYTLDLAGRKASPGHGVEGHGIACFGTSACEWQYPHCRWQQQSRARSDPRR